MSNKNKKTKIKTKITILIRIKTTKNLSNKLAKKL
ncbi:hypothetical protein LLT1_11785 [Lactococcus cremoris subsp. cremoris TIFN1]|nr:hypothetical protein LLT1_11785 [Lactococcus cremoris subsp. cremoris TIFN1]